MLQSYGINFTGDLLGLALTVCLFAVLGGSRSMWARVTWHACMLVSGITSLSLLPTALTQGDMDVFAYHTLWVLLGVVGALRLRVEYRRYQRTQNRTTPQTTTVDGTIPTQRTGPEPTTVYVITTLP